MKLRPLGDRIVVKRIEEELAKKGNIIIPDTAKEKPQQGEVIYVGKGKVSDKGDVIPMELKVGDKVLFGKYSGTEIKIEGEDLLVMHENDIFAVFE